MKSPSTNDPWIRNAFRAMVACGVGLACSSALAAALTDAGVSISNEGDFLNASPVEAFLTRTTFYAGEGLLTQAGASFGYQPTMYAVVDAGLGRWGQAVASLSDTVTFQSAETQLIKVSSTVGGYWLGHGGGGPQVLSRVQVESSLGRETHVASTYPAGFASVPGVFTYLVDPNGPDWTPDTVQRGGYAQTIEWSVYTNTPYRFGFAVLAVAADGGHAEIHDPLWFDVPEGITISAASGAYYLAPVPEPQTWALLVAGLVMVTAAARQVRSQPRHRC